MAKKQAIGGPQGSLGGRGTWLQSGSKPVAPVAPMRYHTLNHWRGLAALLVVVFHAFGSYPNAAYEDFHPLVGACWMVGGHGWLGVHIFFVVSGYCIAAAVHAGVSRSKSVLSFLRDRALRIYPTYWAALVFLILVGAVTAPFIGKSPATALPQFSPSFLADLALLQPFFGNEYFLLVSWSLAYEVCFYLMCAFGMLLLSAGLSASIVVGVGGLLALFGLVSTAPPFPLNLWPEFYLGVLVFVFLRSRQSGSPLRAGLAFIAGLMLVGIGAATKSSYPLAMFATAAFTALALGCLYPWDKHVSKVRFLRPLAYLGGISYSLYLVHLVVVSKVMNFSNRFVAMDSISVLPTVLGATGAAILAGAAFCRIAEAPLESWRRRVQGRSGEPEVAAAKG